MKRIFSKTTLLGAAILSVLGGGAFLVGCSSSSNNPTLAQFVPFFTPTTTTTATAAPTFSQVEEFGRPAINEGLFVTNAFLNGYNAAQPQQELGAVIASTNPSLTLTNLGTEAATTLTVLQDISTAGQTDGTSRIVDEVLALLPDVMRIDTTISSPVGTPAYANDPAIVENGVIKSANQATLHRAFPAVMPRAGRKLEDDVISITYTVLTDDAVTTENVFYNDTDSAGAAQHQNLNDQVPGESANVDTTGLDGNNEGLGTTHAATFPYLAPPN